MFLVRRFEESLLDLFSEGKLVGTTHTYIGQEANAVGVVSHLDRDLDVIVSNHRCHGHYLAFTGDLVGLLREVMGKEGGVCGGKGGSQHLCNDGFYSNGILGSTVPVATGMALAERERGSGAVVVAFVGDGTLGQGVVYESLNMASLWQLPILYVVENNFYAQSTPSHLNLAGRITARGEAFGIATAELDTTDVEEIERTAGGIVEGMRTHRRPFFLVLNTYRFSPHSKGDDNRDLAEIEKARQRDPLDGRGSAPRRGGARRDRDGAASNGSRRRSRRRSDHGRRDRGRYRPAALRRGAERGIGRALRAARRRVPARRGRPRPVRGRVQDHAGSEHALAGAGDDHAGQRGRPVRGRGRDGAARLPADPRDHVRRLHRPRSRPDRERDRQVPRRCSTTRCACRSSSARRWAGAGATGRRTASRSRRCSSASRGSRSSPPASTTTCARCCTRRSPTTTRSSSSRTSSCTAVPTAARRAAGSTPSRSSRPTAPTPRSPSPATASRTRTRRSPPTAGWRRSRSTPPGG